MAADTVGSSNSVFAKYLLKGLTEPGVPLREAALHVARNVARETNNKQIPQMYGMMLEDVVLVPGSAAPHEARISPPAPIPADQEAWLVVKDSGNASLLEQFIKEFPQSSYAGVARLKLASIASNSTSAASGAVRPSLTFAGSPFFDPICQTWFRNYQSIDKTQIDYLPIQSVGGIQAVTEGAADFGAVDLPLSDEQLKTYRDKNGHVLLLFPTVLGAIVPIYNVPGVIGELNFSHAMLAKIFLGKISNWDDPAIVLANPGVKLPHDKIIVAHRSDISGATFWLTDFLAKSDAEWGPRWANPPRPLIGLMVWVQRAMMA